MEETKIETRMNGDSFSEFVGRLRRYVTEVGGVWGGPENEDNARYAEANINCLLPGGTILKVNYHRNSDFNSEGELTARIEGPAAEVIKERLMKLIREC